MPEDTDSPANSNAPKARTDLARERTRMASERTLMSWIRTSLSMITFGFTIVKFFQYMREADGTVTESPNAPRNMGLLLLGFGTAMVIAAAFMHMKELQELGLPPTHSRWSLGLIVACFVGIVGVAAFASVLLRAGPF
jgi:putative membrane protein